MKKIIVNTQKEFDAIKSDFDGLIIVKGGTLSNPIIVKAFPGNASAELWDNASAVLRDNASAVLWDNASAVLWGNASAELRGNASAELRGNASAVLRGNTSAVLWGNASAELRGNTSAVLWGNASAVLWGNASAKLWGNASAELWDNASAELWDNASAVLRDNASAVLWDNASAVLWGNASAVLWDNASAVANGNSCLYARDKSIVKAGKWTSVHKMAGHSGVITGGVLINQPEIKTASDWCEYNGVTVKDSVAMLFKAVNDDYKSARDFLYMPGTTPEAPDWDGGKSECGGGLHFCASPQSCLAFFREATRFLLCPVALEDMRSPQPSDDYPQKIKARRICGPIVEVDRFGEPVKKEA